jgi:hypothetical protein
MWNTLVVAQRKSPQFSLCWVWVQVRAEGERVFGPNDEEPSREAMDSCNYTAAALKVGQARLEVAGAGGGGGRPSTGSKCTCGE